MLDPDTAQRLEAARTIIRKRIANQKNQSIIVPHEAHDRGKEQESKASWKSILAIAFGLGVVLLAGIVGASTEFRAPQGRT